MFQGITVTRNRPEERGRGRSHLPLNKTLLGVDWRFLAVADDEPGFLTAWLQPRSLEQMADRREEECQHSVLADFANEHGIHGVFATPHSGSHASQDTKEIGTKGAFATAHDRSHVNQGEARIKTVGKDNEEGKGGDDGGVEHAVDAVKEREERENIEHVGRDSTTATTSLDESGDNSSHQMATYSLDGRRKERNSLISALKKGGVHFPLEGGDNSHSDDAGDEWDGVDLASAPCLQSHVARNAAEARRMSRKPSTRREDGSGTCTVRRSTVRAEDVRDKKLATRRDAEPAPTQPSAPPTLMVFKPCLSVKLAENVPAELQTVIPVPESRRSRLGRLAASGVSQAQSKAGEKSLQERAVDKLRIDLSLKEISPTCPTCPQGPRPSKQGRRKRSAEAPKEVPTKPRFRHKIPPEPTFRASSYGKAWYVDPELWGVGISSEADRADLRRKDQYAKGLKQQLTHAEAVKATIPTLFSATRFVSYIRQKGLRMPAHLERTERAMEEDKLRATKARQFRNFGQDPLEDGNNDDDQRQDWDNNDDKDDDANPRMKWQSKLDATMRLIRQRERRTFLGTQATPPSRNGKSR